MTTWLEGNRSFFLGAQASLITEDREIASSWASKHVVHNPAHAWVLGRFVEADRANNNRQLFSLKGLQMARPSIQHAPMNMNHEYRHVVGAYVAAELIYPTTESAAVVGGEPCPRCGEPTDPGMGITVCASCERSLEEARVSDAYLNPFIEALGVVWKHYFRKEHEAIEAAHAEGRLFYSMECIPREIQCTGVGGCGETFTYAGRQAASYCVHLNESASDKLLIQPHFTAGAILIPPVRPGWSNADVHSLVAAHASFAEQVYEGVKEEMPHLSPADWEALMNELLTLAR